MYVLAIAASTGWSERFIRWELPLTRGWAYYHAARLMEGQKCVWPEVIADEYEEFEQLRAKWCKK